MDNGSKIPFGPHGEGCECGQEELDEQGIEMPMLPEPTERDRLIALVNVIFTMASDHLTEHMTNAFQVLTYMGMPLSREQMKHVLAAQMRGFTQSHAAAVRVSESFVKAQEQHEEKATDKGPQVRVGSLKELLDGFDGS